MIDTNKNDVNNKLINVKVMLFQSQYTITRVVKN